MFQPSFFEICSYSLPQYDDLCWSFWVQSSQSQCAVYAELYYSTIDDFSSTEYFFRFKTELVLGTGRASNLYSRYAFVYIYIRIVL